MLGTKDRVRPFRRLFLFAAGRQFRCEEYGQENHGPEIRPEPGGLLRMILNTVGRRACGGQWQPMHQPALDRIEPQAAKEGTQPDGDEIDDHRAVAKDLPDRGHARPGSSQRRRSRRPRPRRAKRLDESAPRRSARKPWHKHKAECPLPSERESKADRCQDVLAAYSPVTWPRSPRRSPRRPRAARPDRAAGSRIHTGPRAARLAPCGRPHSTNRCRAGGRSASAEFARPNTSTSAPPMTPVTKAAMGRKMAKIGPNSA